MHHCCGLEFFEELLLTHNLDVVGGLHVVAELPIQLNEGHLIFQLQLQVGLTLPLNIV